MGQRILVTGAGGFVGANLVRRLLADGHDVHVAVRPEGTLWRLDPLANDLRQHACDLRDVGAVTRVVVAARPDWVMHLASFGAYSWQHDVRRIVETNLLGTMTVLDAAVAAGAEAFIHTGSSSEYGYKDHPAREDELPEPNSHYAVAKAAATMHCRHIARSHDVHAVTLRLYSVYGPWEEPRRLVPRLVEHALRGTLPALVDAATARDFVYVDDAVEALVRAAGRTTLMRGTVLNVGTGQQRSIGEIVETVRRTFGIDEVPRYGTFEPRRWDTNVWVADTSRIRTELNWMPRWSLEDGLKATADWLSAEPAAVRYRR